MSAGPGVHVVPAVAVAASRSRHRGHVALGVAHRRGRDNGGNPSTSAANATAAGDLQSPTFDLDAPAAVQGGHDGVWLLLVPPLKARHRVRIARRLARGGFADPTWAASVAEGASRERGTGRQTVLQLSVPVRAEPSPRAGHTVVVVEEPMSFARSCRLAEALGLLVDAQQAALARRRGRWAVLAG